MSDWTAGGTAPNVTLPARTGGGWQPGSGAPTAQITNIAAAADRTPDPAPPPPTPDPPAYVPTAGEFATLRALLTRYGLLSLYDKAVGWMVDGVADSPERLDLALRETTEFQSRFRGMLEREAQGLPAISIDEALAFEDQAYKLMRAYDYPPGFYDSPDDFQNLIARNVSAVELEQRLSERASIIGAGREVIREEMRTHALQTWGGSLDDATFDALSDADFAALYTDPERGLQALRGRVASAKLSAQARNAGFGGLSAAEADRLAGVGMDEGGAATAFGALVGQREVIGALAGEGEGLSRERVLAAAGGDAAAVRELEQRARARVGQQQRGGGFAGGNQGLGGLGSS